MNISTLHTRLESQFKEFSQLLTDKMGLYFPQERWGDLEKKMHFVMHAFGFDNLEKCIEWLLKTSLNKEQITVLAYHLTIGETYFFRNPEMFSLLENSILPEIINRHKQDKQLRLWSAGCCTGEEPYSLAILLHQILPDISQWDIQIVGTDINKEFLRKAEEAHYKKWSFRSISQQYITRYFLHQGEGVYSLKPEIQQMVKFQELNLVQDTYPDQNRGTDRMDLVLCHNVLIYFSEKQINKTIHQIAKSLVEGGFLSVTSIEAPFVNCRDLKPCHYSGHTFYRKEQGKKSDAAIPPVAAGHAPEKPQSSRPMNESDIILKVMLPAFLNLTESVIEMRFSSEPLASTVKSEPLEITKEEKKQNFYEDALKHYQKKEYDLAIQYLKYSLYLNPDFIASHYILGMLYQEKGNDKEAKKEFNTILELLKDTSSEEVLPGLEDFTAGRLKEFLRRLV